LRLDDPLVPMKLLPEKEVQGKKCLGLEIVADDGKPTSLYIDPDTHMILAMEYMGTDFEQGTEAPKRVELSDFRPILGTIMPFKSIEYTGDKKTSEELIQSIELRDEVPATVFDMPPRKLVQGLGREPVVVPFEYLSNEVIVKAKVNDKTELRFLLDTGATQNVMERKSATAFGAIAKSDMSLTTGSGFVTMGGIVLQSLQIGDIKLTDVPMAVADMPGFAQISGGRPAGILGANILRRFAVTVDYEQRKVYFCDPEKLVVPDGATILMAEPALGSGGLSVNGLLDGQLKIRLLVDTGAAFNSISEPLIKPVLDFPLLHVGSVEGVDGFKVSVGAVQLHKLSLDQLSVDAPIFSVAPGAADSKMPVGLLSASSLGILGNPFWSHFRLTVDYLNGRVILEQSKLSISTFAILKDLREVLVTYHKDRNANDAVAALDKLLLQVQSSDMWKAKTIITLARAQLLGEKVTGLKPDDLLPVVKNFDAAFALAKDNNDPGLESRILAQEALFLLDHKPGYNEVRNILQLIKIATTLSSSEPDVLVAAAVFYGAEVPGIKRKMIDRC
jgi:predicted aspartyl protease